jgi:hypothetical protein
MSGCAFTLSLGVIVLVRSIESLPGAAGELPLAGGWHLKSAIRQSKIFGPKTFQVLYEISGTALLSPCVSLVD